MKFAQLVYGPAGGGKTDYALSALWDQKTKTFKRPGLYVTFGKEGNSANDIPLVTFKDVAAGKSGRVKLTSPTLDSTKFAKDFLDLARGVYKLHRKALAEGKPVPFEVVIVDGITEFGLLYEQSFRNENPSAEKWAVWNTLLNYCVSVMQLLDPEELDAFVLVTARASEKRKGIENKSTNTVVGADPDYTLADNIPYINGQFRDQLPHYFALVNYVKTEVKATQRNGQPSREPVHSVRMVATDGEFLVKNQWERQWLASGKPRELDNTDFDSVLKIIEEL